MDAADRDCPSLHLLVTLPEHDGSRHEELEASGKEQVNVFEWSFGSCPSPVYDIIDFIPSSPRDDTSEVSDCQTDSDHSTIPSNSRQSNMHEPLIESDMCADRQPQDDAQNSSKADHVHKSPKQLLSFNQLSPLAPPDEAKKSPSQLPPISPSKPESAAPSSRSEHARGSGGRRDIKTCPPVPPFVVLSPLTPTKPAPPGRSASDPSVSEVQQLLKEHKERARSFMRKAVSDGRLIRGPSPMTRAASHSSLSSRAGDLESRRRSAKAAEIKVESLARVPAKPPIEALENFGSAAGSISRSDRTSASMLLKLQHSRARDYEAARPEARDEELSSRMGLRGFTGRGGGPHVGSSANLNAGLAVNPGPSASDRDAAAGLHPSQQGQHAVGSGARSSQRSAAPCRRAVPAPRHATEEAPAAEGEGWGR